MRPLGEDMPEEEDRSADVKGAGGLRTARTLWKRLPFGVRLFLLSLTAFVIGLASVNYILMPMIVHQSTEVKVPSLAGLPVNEAESALIEKDLSLVTIGSVYDAEVPEGRVVRQDPAAGTSVRKKRSVSVVLSKGPDVATVPQLEGESLRHAKMLLARLGLRSGLIAHSYSPEVPADYVIGTDPPAGVSLQKGASVAMLVSLGPEGDDFVMPDLRGLPLRETAHSLEAMGFDVRVMESSSSSFFRRRVPMIEKQRPLPGKRLRKGDEIQLSS